MKKKVEPCGKGSSTCSSSWGWGFDDLSMAMNLHTYPLTRTGILTVIPKRNLLLDRKVLSFFGFFFFFS